MRRNIDYASNSVTHNYLKIPEDFQDKGAGKKLFQSLLIEYEAANLKKIKLIANKKIGGYAWAKYGFYATSKREVLRIINRSSDKTFKAKSLIKG